MGFIDQDHDRPALAGLLGDEVFDRCLGVGGRVAGRRQPILFCQGVEQFVRGQIGLLDAGDAHRALVLLGNGVQHRRLADSSFTHQGRDAPAGGHRGAQGFEHRRGRAVQVQEFRVRPQAEGQAFELEPVGVHNR